MSLLWFLLCKSSVNLKECVALLQLLFYNRKRALHWMDGCNWNREITQYLWKKDDCKCLFQRNTVPLKIVDHCKWPPEIMTVLLKYMAASALRKIPYPLKNGWPQLLLWNKETLYSEKILFPAIKQSNLQGKNVFSGTTTLDHSLYLWAAISLRFSYIYH